MASKSASGVEAERPTEFGKPAWRDVGRRSLAEVKKDHLSMIAAGVAFYFFLALFPAIAAAVSIYGMVADPADVQRALEGARGVLPSQAVDLVSQQMGTIAASSGAALGLGAILGILLALWSASKGTKAFMEALNIAYDETERRGFLRLNATALILTLGVIVYLIAAITLVALLPALIGGLGLPQVVQTVLQWSRWPLLALAMIVGLALLYRYAPSRQAAKWQWVSLGAVVATILWLIASSLFSLYAANSGSYNETYGSLAAIVILLMWFYISAYVVLLGGEMNSEMERQTARDTTTGAPRPLGAREATAADTVAAEGARAGAASRPHGKEGRAPAAEGERRYEGGEEGRWELERQAARTRREIDATLRELGERLAPTQMRARVARRLRVTSQAVVPGEGGLRDKPLLLGSLGVAAGALLAAALPRRGGDGIRPPG